MDKQVRSLSLVVPEQLRPPTQPATEAAEEKNALCQLSRKLSLRDLKAIASMFKAIVRPHFGHPPWWGTRPSSETPRNGLLNPFWSMHIYHARIDLYIWSFIPWRDTDWVES